MAASLGSTPPLRVPIRQTAVASVASMRGVLLFSILCLVSLLGVLTYLGSFPFGGYAVEELGSETDLRLQELEEGQLFTLAEVTETDCSEVGIVGTYRSARERNAVIGRADVSTNHDLFVLMAAFDGEGNRLQETRLSQSPRNLSDLGTGRFSCGLEYVVENGRISVAR